METQLRSSQPPDGKRPRRRQLQLSHAQMGGGTLGARAEGGVELRGSRAAVEGDENLLGGVAGMTSQNNGCTVNITHKLTYTCTHRCTPTEIHRHI